jgi:hypothetical protein
VAVAAAAAFGAEAAAGFGAGFSAAGADIFSAGTCVLSGAEVGFVSSDTRILLQIQNQFIRS